MKDILILSETSRGFHDKLTVKTLLAFRQYGCNTTVVHGFDNLVVDKPYDLIHIARLLSPERLLRFLDETDFPQASFLLMGLSEQFRSLEKMTYLKILQKHPKVRRVIVMSIDPVSCLRAALDQEVTEKTVFLHEPPYETREYYREIGMQQARMRLGLSMSNKLCLYFGTYFFSKGPDIALKAARLCPEIDFAFVGDRSIGSIEINPLEFINDKNIRFVNEYVSEAVARDWFRAANVIQIPYRKFYEHDTSGIFNQAMLAQRPVVVPNFAPFNKIISTRRLAVGGVFEAEDPESLAQKIRQCVSVDYVSSHFDKYLERQTKWSDIAKEVLR